MCKRHIEILVIGSYRICRSQATSIICYSEKSRQCIPAGMRLIEMPRAKYPADMGSSLANVRRGLIWYGMTNITGYSKLFIISIMMN